MWHSASTLTNQCALHWRALSQVFKIQNTPKQTPPVEVEKIVYIEVEKIVEVEKVLVKFVEKIVEVEKKTVEAEKTIVEVASLCNETMIDDPYNVEDSQERFAKLSLGPRLGSTPRLKHSNSFPSAPQQIKNINVPRCLGISPSCRLPAGEYSPAQPPWQRSEGCGMCECCVAETDKHLGISPSCQQQKQKAGQQQ